MLLSADWNMPSFSLFQCSLFNICTYRLMYEELKLRHQLCLPTACVHVQREGKGNHPCAKHANGFSWLLLALDGFLPSIFSRAGRRNWGFQGCTCTPCFLIGKDQNLARSLQIRMVIKWRAPPDFSSMLQPWSQEGDFLVSFEIFKIFWNFWILEIVENLWMLKNA